VDVYNLLVSQSHTPSLFLATVRRRRLQSHAIVANILATAAGCCVFKFLRANSNKSQSENISSFCRLFSRSVRGCRSTASGPRIAPVAKCSGSARRSRVEKVLETSKITIRSLSTSEVSGTRRERPGFAVTTPFPSILRLIPPLASRASPLPRLGLAILDTPSPRRLASRH
jgi:hypothetical protein